MNRYFAIAVVVLCIYSSITAQQSTDILVELNTKGNVVKETYLETKNKFIT